MRAPGDELVRSCERRLLDERLGNESTRARGLAALDVAESRLGHRRRDAERDEAALPRKLGAAHHRGRKRDLVSDQVIGGEHEHDGIVAVTRPHEQRRDRHRRSGVSPERLEQVRGVTRLGVGQSRIDILRVKVKVPVGHGHEAPAAGNCDGSPCGLAEQRVAVGKRHEGLGRGLARERPQSCARASRENDWNDVGHEAIR